MVVESKGWDLDGTANLIQSVYFDSGMAVQTCVLINDKNWKPNKKETNLCANTLAFLCTLCLAA